MSGQIRYTRQGVRDLNAGRKHVKPRNILMTCSTCDGLGWVGHTSPKRCPECRGAGKMWVRDTGDRP